MANISDILEQELKHLPENWIFMLETSAEKSLNVNIQAMKILTHKLLSPIYISTSRICTDLIKIYSKNNIDVDKIFILCFFCKFQRVSTKDTEKVIHFSNVSTLTKISLDLTGIKGFFKHGKTFFFLDSITGSMYKNPKVLAKFVHRILVKMRISNINGILIAIEEDIDRGIRAEIAQLCDKVIRI